MVPGTTTEEEETIGVKHNTKREIVVPTTDKAPITSHPDITKEINNRRQDQLLSRKKKRSK
jgi:hypothetical protein